MQTMAFQSLQPIFIENDEQLAELRKEIAAGPTNLVLLAKHHVPRPR